MTDITKFKIQQIPTFCNTCNTMTVTVTVRTVFTIKKKKRNVTFRLQLCEFSLIELPFR